MTSLFKDATTTINKHGRKTTPSEPDIAVAAKIKLTKENSSIQLNPIYLIRENAIIPIPDRKANPGVSVQFSKINPETGVMSFEIAFHPSANAFPLRFFAFLRAFALRCCFAVELYL